MFLRLNLKISNRLHRREKQTSIDVICTHSIFCSDSSRWPDNDRFINSRLGGHYTIPRDKVPVFIFFITRSFKVHDAGVLARSISMIIPPKEKKTTTTMRTCFLFVLGLKVVVVVWLVLSNGWLRWDLFNRRLASFHLWWRIVVQVIRRLLPVYGSTATMNKWNTTDSQFMLCICPIKHQLTISKLALMEIACVYAFNCKLWSCWF